MEEVTLLKQRFQNKKIIKLILIIIIIFVYYLINGVNFNPFSIYLMLPIGFIFTYQTRNKKIDYIDIVVLALLLIIIIMIMFPIVDFLGIFKQYIVSSSQLLSLIIFLFGYFLGYFITKEKNYH